MKKILYVHGLGGSGNGTTFENLKKLFENYDIEVISHDFPFNPYACKEDIMTTVCLNKVDMVIASSLGAFVSTCAFVEKNLKIPLIVINPALDASSDILNNFGYGEKEYRKKREDGIQTYNLNQEFYNDLAFMQNTLYMKVLKGRMKFTNIYGIFSRNDEYFHNATLFKKCISYNYVMIDDTHSISKDSLSKYVVPKALKLLK